MSGKSTDLKKQSRIKMKSKIILGLLLVTSNALFAVPQYTIAPLDMYAVDINDHGQIVGSSENTYNGRAVISTEVNGKRVITNLGVNDLGSKSSIANAINNNGQVVGTYVINRPEYQQQFNSNRWPEDVEMYAYITEKQGDTWVATHLSKGVAHDINDSEQVALRSSLSTRVKQAIRVAYKNDDSWSLVSVDEAFGEGSDLRINTDWGLNARIPVLINNNERVTFHYGSLRMIRTVSIIDKDGAWQRTGSISGNGASETYILGINDLNQATGSSIMRNREGLRLPFIATENEDGLWKVEYISDEYGRGDDINDLGVVVGTIPSLGGGFIYTNGKIHILSDLVSSGLDGWSSISSAIGINNSGEIIGHGIYHGKEMSFLLTLGQESTAICEVGFSPQTIKKGEGSALWWWTQGGSSATINQDIGNIELPSNYQWFFPTETKTYTLSVKGKHGFTRQCRAKITVEGICELGADPQEITKGEGAALWWWTDNTVVTQNIDRHVGGAEDTPSGYHWISPQSTTTYTMTAKTADGTPTTCETTIVVKE